MQVFVYEFVTGGGFLGGSEEIGPTGSLLTEGAAMVVALATDFASLTGCRVVVMCDNRLRCRLSRIATHAGVTLVPVENRAEHEHASQTLAADSDWTVVIAPEIGDALQRTCDRIRAAGGRILGPGTLTTAWASNKQRTAEFLTRRGIRTPVGVSLDGATLRSPNCELEAMGSGPIVVKPVDGAGSWSVRKLVAPSKLPTDVEVTLDQMYRVETFVPGRAASVGLLLGPRQPVVLQPCWQHLTTDDRFGYLGGEVMSSVREGTDVARVRALGMAVARACPNDVGYMGVDCVLGTEIGEDVVIEVNPRLTSSYLGLRQATSMNLAEGMLAVADGRSFHPEWSLTPRPFCVDNMS